MSACGELVSAFYNEIDPYCAAWLRSLIAAGELPDGDVAECGIEELSSDDVRGYDHVHLFAGIGGWGLAARLAGWSGELWTGSCPCQPYSSAGKRLADDDPRNLWPEFYRLVRECRPPAVAGEQVASAAGRLWLAGVRADLAAIGYAVGAVDLPAASVGAPHIRQRLWWVADAGRSGLSQWAQRDERQDEPGQPAPHGHHAVRRSDLCGLGDTSSERAGRDGRAVPRAQAPGEREWIESGGVGDGAFDAGAACAWSDAAWIPCADGKARRIEPGVEPLADGLPGRVGRARAYGNAIVPQVAAEVLMAWMNRMEAA